MKAIQPKLYTEGAEGRETLAIRPAARLRFSVFAGGGAGPRSERSGARARLRSSAAGRQSDVSPDASICYAPHKIRRSKRKGALRPSPVPTNE